ncbi:MAG: HEPN domain-containing protein [Selenomonadaceae bacterium]|nr:HEPN domain-containing protein [Selenomonadaceae bacterium]
MSKDETLLDLAKRNMDIANLLYSHKESDDGFLNHVGYHLQQCVELAVKHFLETHGIEYSFTHDIDELLDQVPTEYQVLFDPISDLAGTITNMEAKTRYIKNYRLSERIVSRVLPLANQLLQNIGEVDKKERLSNEAEANAEAVTGQVSPPTAEEEGNGEISWNEG